MVGMQISNSQAADIAFGRKTSGQVRQEISQNSARSNGVLNATSGSSFQDIAGKLSDITNYNNQWSAAQADKAMSFNRDEAQKNRDWQEYMSNTAHQREVKDLIAAGLNPILSITGGQGAPVTSGATATGYAPTADNTLGQGLVSLFGNLLSVQTSLANKALDAQTNLAVADKYNATSKYAAELQSQTQLTTANISAMASKYAADVHASSAQVVASINAAVAKYGYDVASMTQKQIAAFNADVNRELQQKNIDAKFDMAKYYPSTLFQAAGSAASHATDIWNDAKSAAGSFLDDMFGLFTGKGFSSYSGK